MYVFRPMGWISQNTHVGLPPAFFSFFLFFSCQSSKTSKNLTWHAGSRRAIPTQSRDCLRGVEEPSNASGLCWSTEQTQGRGEDKASFHQKSGQFFLSGGSEPRTAAPVAVACAPFTCKSAYSSGQKRNVNLQKRKFALAETTLNFHKKKFHSEIIICCTSHDLDEVSPASNATPWLINVTLVPATKRVHADPRRLEGSWIGRSPVGDPEHCHRCARATFAFARTTRALTMKSAMSSNVLWLNHNKSPWINYHQSIHRVMRRACGVWRVACGSCARRSAVMRAGMLALNTYTSRTWTWARQAWERERERKREREREMLAQTSKTIKLHKSAQKSNGVQIKRNCQC